MKEMARGAGAPSRWPRPAGGWARGAVAAAVIVAAVAASVPHLHAAVDQRELRAREAFAIGRYQEALDLFGKLYAEKLHPNYLRNIGRCYQNLGDPDRAINSFRDYLRTAKGLRAEERAEIEGFIKEMEQLKAQQSAPAAQTPSPATAAAAANRVDHSAAGAALPAATGSAPGSTQAAAAPDLGTSATSSNLAAVPASAPAANLVQSDGASPGPSNDRPLYGRWWFWAIVGGVVATGVGIAAAAGAFTTTQEPDCSKVAGVTCP